jgi:tripartite-type tricarboxylate transporter receptor subunit TctC
VFAGTPRSAQLLIHPLRARRGLLGADACVATIEQQSREAGARELHVQPVLTTRFGPTACAILCALVACVTSSHCAVADPVEDFYRGKQIRIVIRAAPGGNYDLYSRLLARHIVRFIPGQPVAIPVNMPGGSGLTALNYVADVHPRDGSVLTMVTQTFPLEQALALNDKLKVDLRALNWIANMSDATSVLLTSRMSATRTIEDAKRRETIIGVPSLADASAWLTMITNGTLGTRFKLVPGYTSGPNMNLAMERGEIEGRGTSNPKAMFAGGSERGADGRPLFNPIVQWGLKPNPDYPEAPLLIALAATPEQKVVFDFVGRVASLARPIATNQDVPPERVAALRRAFDSTMKDPEFLSEAERQLMEIRPMAGEGLARLVTDIVNAPASVVDEVRRAVR